MNLCPKDASKTYRISSYLYHGKHNAFRFQLKEIEALPPKERKEPSNMILLTNTEKSSLSKFFAAQPPSKLIWTATKFVDQAIYCFNVPQGPNYNYKVIREQTGSGSSQPQPYGSK